MSVKRKVVVGTPGTYTGSSGKIWPAKDRDLEDLKP